MSTWHPGRAAAPTLLALGLALTMAACGPSSGGAGSGSDAGSGSGDGGGGARTVDVALTDAGCEPARLDLPAGATTFRVTNRGTDKVSEFEITGGGRTLGEAEDVTAGLERSFSLNLAPGTYELKCPGGAGAAEGTLTVR